jgi:enoyl-CoA hydratase/carnithine racemase
MSPALDMILTGNTIMGTKALSLRLVDAVVEFLEDLMKTATQWAIQAAAASKSALKDCCVGHR